MRVVEDLAHLQEKDRGIVLTLGNFDGIHLGHQEIIKRVVARAHEINCKSVVFTFQEHPLKILADGQSPPLLTTLEEKFSLVEGLGIDLVISIPFTKEIASKSADEFIQNIIVSLLCPHLIIVGHDYAFGRNRIGDSELLEKWGVKYGYRVEVVDAVVIAGVTVSSTVIRKKIAQGRVEEVSHLLGRPYSIQSEVITGGQKGKGLSFRTANLAPQPKLLPALGVYAVRVQLDNNKYQGVANIGYQPTYGQNELQIEVHLLGFDRNLYGHSLTIDFIARLRGEQKFADESELNRQIGQDISRAREILAGFV